MKALRQIPVEAEVLVSLDPRPSSPVGASVRRGASSSLRRAWRDFRAIVAWIEGSIVGDLIGCACLFATFFLLVIMAGVLA